MRVEETIDLKSNFFYHKLKNVDVKVRGNVVRKLRVRRRSIFHTLCRNRQY